MGRLSKEIMLQISKSDSSNLQTLPGVKKNNKQIYISFLNTQEMVLVETGVLSHDLLDIQNDGDTLYCVVA